MEVLNGHKVMEVRSETTYNSAMVLTFKVHCEHYDKMWSVYRILYGEPLECIYCGREVLR